MKERKKGAALKRNPEGAPPGEEALVRKLGLFDSTMIVMGIVIGSGIFLTTGLMAKEIPSPSLLLLAWIVGGLLSLAGALTYAELGAAMPLAGGQYVYLREAYGPLSGFLFGWIMFLVYQTGSIAAVAVGFAEYLGYFFPSIAIQRILFTTSIFGLNYTLSAGQLIAILSIILLSILNYGGLGFGSLIQNAFTVLKVGAIAALVVLGFTIGRGGEIDFSLAPAGTSTTGLVGAFGVAMIAVLWTYDGWNNINFTAGEIKNPKRNLPLSLLLGTLAICAIYVAVNYVYLYALPINELKGVTRVAEKAATGLFGPTAASFISAAVVISTFGCVNGMILTGPRVYYAMAKDNLFFRKVSQVHPRFKTPGFSIFVQAVWSSLLVFSGTYEQLFTYVVFAALLFYLWAAASVFTLRRKFPHLERPYKVWGYPVVPALYILASVWILINTLVERPVESLAGMGIVAVGIPVYYYWKRKAIPEGTGD